MNLPLTPLITPRNLLLFDGSSATSGEVTHFVDSSAVFQDGTKHNIRFLVTRLEVGLEAVLGYSWLRARNPQIDWRLGNVRFRASSKSLPAGNLDGVVPQEVQEPHSRLPGFAQAAPIVAPTPILQGTLDGMEQDSVPSTNPASNPAQAKASMPDPIPLNEEFLSTPVDIQEISARAIRAELQNNGNKATLILLRSSSLSTPTPDEASRASVPKEFHEYLDVFDEGLSELLPEHRPYDLKIELEEGTSPPMGPIYGLKANETAALKEWIQDRLKRGRIRPSDSPAG